MKDFRLILILLLLGFAPLSCSKNSDLQTQVIRINQWELTVETADTLESQEKGLMGRENLDENRGMLFVYERDAKKSFWMKNTTIPLSIAYIAADGTIREIYDMEPLSTRTVDSRYSVRYALEVNQGAFDRHGIKAGDKVEFIKP
ncbi:MAG: DUF192 domain-containing protein [Spirochaetales bacterium]|nr:DUF192 domain-containing protein [Spirochaetales bacterium]